MSIVYFGTSEFAVPAMEAVAGRISLVVTQPDRPSGRGMRLQPSPVKARAEELGLRVVSPEKAREPGFIEAIRAETPDFLLVAAYGQILSTALLESAKHGGINLHGSILPKYRGAAPIQRCILQGDAETGVTLMQMDKGMDTGDMIAIERTSIGEDETYGELQTRLAQIAAGMARDWFDRLASGNYPRTPQDPAMATIAPKVRKEECELSFERTAEEEYNRFRAFSPSPGTFFNSIFGRVKVGNARKSELTGPPGSLVGPDTIAFRSSALQLLEVQPEGKKRMTGRDFANGMRLKPGDRLC